MGLCYRVFGLVSIEARKTLYNEIMNKKRFIVVIILVFLLLAAKFAYNAYQKNYIKNYTKTFYNSLEKGDVTSNECLNRWNNFFDNVIYDRTTTYDYLYDYNKKRCLLDTYKDFSLTLDTVDKSIHNKDTFSDLITQKILFQFEYSDQFKPVVIFKDVFDYENNKEWHWQYSPDRPIDETPYVSFQELKNLSK